MFNNNAHLLLLTLILTITLTFNPLTLVIKHNL